jgi:hypothetical protein
MRERPVSIVEALAAIERAFDASRDQMSTPRKVAPDRYQAETEKSPPRPLEESRVAICVGLRAKWTDASPRLFGDPETEEARPAEEKYLSL